MTRWTTSIQNFRFQPKRQINVMSNIKKKRSQSEKKIKIKESDKIIDDKDVKKHFKMDAIRKTIM